jgi:serine/threonine-protein kinase
LVEKLGNYRVKELIGRGATATVYRGEHVWLGRQVALKVVPKGTARFLDEARALSQLSHPGLVKIYECELLEGGGAWLAMEMLEGEVLRARLTRMGKLPFVEILDIVQQLADALACVHEAGLVHRDLKPSNIFLAGDRVKLLDFGLAKHADRKRTAPGDILGTPYYMPPEQCRGLPDIDRRADVYALGAVLFEMAAGRPPFVYDSVAAVIHAHLTENPPPLDRPDLPPLVDEVVAQALAKNREQRFVSTRALAAALGASEISTRTTETMKTAG